MPIFLPTPGLGETKANGGFKIRLGTTLSDYREFMISASDDFGGWDGSWKTFVVDPTKAGSVADTGSFDVGSIRYIGCYMDAQALAKGDNVFISQISVGFGLRITGTSTTAWKDVVDYCTDYPNRVWPMFQERDGIYYSFGKTFIGDSTSQVAAVSFTDSARVIQYGTSEYWNGSAWVTLADIDYSGIVIEDHSSYTTTFTDGVIVGTDNGRSGSVIIGNSNHDISLDLYGGNHVDSVTALYGTTFKDINGVINSGDDSGHKFLGVSFNACAQFDPVGAPVIRNCTFAETADVDAALLWNENIDIEDCNFIANTLGAAIEHPSAVGTPYAHTNLLYSGNTYDVLNSSGSAITVTKAGTSNPSTSEGSSVTYQASLTMTITVKDEDTDPIQNVQTSVHKISDRTELMNEDTNVSGIATEPYVGATPVDVEIRCRKASSGTTKYINFSTLATLS